MTDIISGGYSMTEAIQHTGVRISLLNDDGIKSGHTRELSNTAQMFNNQLLIMLGIQKILSNQETL